MSDIWPSGLMDKEKLIEHERCEYGDICVPLSMLEQVVKCDYLMRQLEECEAILRANPELLDPEEAWRYTCHSVLLDLVQGTIEARNTEMGG